MSILKIKNSDNEWVSITTIRGERGPQGEKGPQGEQGPQGEKGESTTYEAGTGIEIVNDQISADLDVVQSKLTAGANITITGNTISAASLTAGTGIDITDGVISVNFDNAEGEGF